MALKSRWPNPTLSANKHAFLAAKLLAIRKVAREIAAIVHIYPASHSSALAARKLDDAIAGCQGAFADAARDELRGAGGEIVRHELLNPSEKGTKNVRAKKNRR